MPDAGYSANSRRNSGGLDLDTYKLMADEFSWAPFGFTVCMVANNVEKSICY